MRGVVDGRFVIDEWPADAKGRIGSLGLSGLWLMKKGDDKAYSDPARPDHDWSPVPVPLNWFDLPDGGYSGLGWYRLHLRMPDAPSGEALGIELGWIDDADETYFNGRLIGTTGRFPRSEDADNEEHAYDRTRIYPIPCEAVRWGGDNLLAVRVGSMRYDTAGIYKERQRIGSLSSLLKDFYALQSIPLILATLYLLVASYHALLFYKRPHALEHIIYAVFTAAIGLLTLLRGQLKYFIIDSFTPLKFAEYVIELVLASLFLHFLIYFFEKKSFNRASVILDSSVMCCIAYLILNFSDLTAYFRLNTYVRYALFGSCTIYCVWYLARFRKLMPEAGLMLAGFSVFGLTILVDIASGILVTSIPWLSQYGFFAFVLSIALVMGERHSRLFREIVEAEARLKQYSCELQNKNEELVKLIDIREELAAARRIQQSNLPSRLPEIPGIDMAAVCLPMKDVGGDFYDFHLAGDNKSLGALIADVTGHGIPAALVAAMTKIAFSLLCDHARDPGVMLGEMNKVLCEKVKTTFLAAGYVFIDLQGMSLVHANAGHQPLLVYKKNRAELLLINPRGILVGWDVGSVYETERVEIARGDRIIMYTDGITESRDPRGTHYGDEAFHAMIRESIGLSAGEFTRCVMERVQRFVGRARSQQDDLTLLVIDIR